MDGDFGTLISPSLVAHVLNKNLKSRHSTNIARDTRKGVSCPYSLREDPNNNKKKIRLIVSNYK